MSTALYRRYRPESFADVIGQEHVTEPLMQALRTGRTNHAYLFSGPRGCGKTTSARILARCLNCEQGPTPTPCGECQSCVALARGGSGSVDVIEIDAASHGGVDDARDLREKASYGPAQSRYKVYIIDEAHMVTPQGFNALLKIVEEPPEHVKFIFATTEPEKVIGTIRSRTHHYPFRLVPPARLQEYLEELCAREGVAVEPGVLSFVIRAGGGSVRDSLSVLDQLIAGSHDEGLTYAGAAALLGFTEAELLDATVDAVAARDGAAVFRQIDRIIETGQDPRRFVEDLLERLRDLIVVAALNSAGSDGASAIFRGLPQDQLDRMQQQAAAFGAGELSYAADTVNTGLTEMTGATSPRLQLELICARLLLPRAAGEHGFAARIDRLEQRLEMAGPQPPTRVGSGPAAGGSSEAAPRGRAAVAPEAPAARPPSAPVADETADGGAAGPSARPVVAADGDDANAGGAPAASSEPAGREGVLVRPSTPEAGLPAATGAGDPARGRPAAPAAAGSPGAPSSPAAPPPTGASTPPPRGGLDTDALRRAWPDVLAKVFGIRRVTWTFLSEHAQVLDFDGERLLIGIATRGLAQTFRNGQHAEVVRQALIDARGIDTRVEGVALDDAATQSSGAARSAAPDSGAGPRGGGDASASHAQPHGAPTSPPRQGVSASSVGQGAVNGPPPAAGAAGERGGGDAPGQRAWPGGAAESAPAASSGPDGRAHGGREQSADGAPSTDPDDPSHRAGSSPEHGGGPVGAGHSDAGVAGGDRGVGGAFQEAGRSPSGEPSSGHDPRPGSSAESSGHAAAVSGAAAAGDARGGGAVRPTEAAATARAPRNAVPWGPPSDVPPPEEPPDDDVPPEYDDVSVSAERGAPTSAAGRATAQPAAQPPVSHRPEPSRPGTAQPPTSGPTTPRAALTQPERSQPAPAPVAPAPVASEPSSHPDPVGDEVASPAGEASQPQRAASSGGSRRGIEAFRAARRAQRDRSESPAGRRDPSTGVADDAVARDDDEDITDLSAVGQPVIAAVLGGTVIGETQE